MHRGSEGHRSQIYTSACCLSMIAPRLRHSRGVHYLGFASWTTAGTLRNSMVFFCRPDIVSTTMEANWLIFADGAGVTGRPSPPVPPNCHVIFVATPSRKVTRL